MEARPPKRPGPGPETLLRRLQSLLPVSPLPWHWHRRLNRGVLAAIVFVAVGGAIASVLLQGDSSQRAEVRESSAPGGGPASKLGPQELADGVMISGLGDPAAAASDLRSSKLAGVLVRAEDWPGRSAGKALIARLRAAGRADGRAPALIVAKQEGGIYRAFPDLPPGERQIDIGDSASPKLAENWALKTGVALRRMGFDLNLAPLADVATLASPIADRAFSDDPVVVSALTAAAIRGCRRSGIGCAVAHFPGLGGASADPASVPATVSLDPSALEHRDLEPFRSAIAAGAPAMVLSLAFYAAYDPVTPGALSAAVAGDLLRDELRFEGVAITDDLSSGAIAGGVGAPEAAVDALAAGADLVLVSNPVEAAQARRAIAAAVRSGNLSPERLVEAAGRVLELKRRLGLLGT